MFKVGDRVEVIGPSYCNTVGEITSIRRLNITGHHKNVPYLGHELNIKKKHGGTTGWVIHKPHNLRKLDDDDRYAKELSEKGSWKDCIFKPEEVVR